jgi:hypothetical protein
MKFSLRGGKIFYRMWGCKYLKKKKFLRDLIKKERNLIERKVNDRKRVK